MALDIIIFTASVVEGDWPSSVWRGKVPCTAAGHNPKTFRQFPCMQL